MKWASIGFRFFFFWFDPFKEFWNCFGQFLLTLWFFGGYVLDESMSKVIVVFCVVVKCKENGKENELQNGDDMIKQFNEV